MKPLFEFLIPATDNQAALLRTLKSLAAQTDGGFGVVLGDGDDGESEEMLTSKGIGVRRLRPPTFLRGIEVWNWLHAHSEGEWVKLLLAGEQLGPLFVERCRLRMQSRPEAQMLRCDVEVRTDWGTRIERAPMGDGAVSPAGFAALGGGKLDWISRSVNIIYTRTAWMATGGYSTQLPRSAALNLNVILALHHGLENIAEPLAVAEAADDRDSLAMGRETWLVLRQARNYCAASKLPWPKRRLWASALAAVLGRG